MKLLHINASPRAEKSYSLQLATQFLDELSKHHELELDRLDLFEENLPAFGTLATKAKMALFSGQDQTQQEIDAWNEIRAIFDRFSKAQLYVFNIPIWNNGIPYILKQYIDLVTQPGWSFGFDPVTGYSGLMTKRKAVVIHASGVWHQDIAANFGSDFSTPFMQDWLNFIGVEEVNLLRVQPTVLNADVAATTEQAKASAVELAAKF